MKLVSVQVIVFICISVCGGCSGTQRELPATATEDATIVLDQSLTGSLTVTPGCLHFTRLGGSAGHSLYVTPNVSSVITASSSNPRQATISPQRVSARAHYTYPFVVTPLAYGKATLTIAAAGNSKHLNETANAPNLYVADASTNSILVFPADANGNVPPTRVISGSNTQLSNPTFIANDCSGNIYVTNDGNNTSVTRYPASASGNVSPTAVIAGANTQLVSPYGIALDSAGRIFVGGSGVSNISVFKANANGNVAPLYTLPPITAFQQPAGLAIDDKDQLYLSYIPSGGTISAIATYSATTSGRPPALLRIIQGAATHLDQTLGIAVSRYHYIWAVNGPAAQVPGVWIFAPGANGNAMPTGTISGANARMTDPFGIAFDSFENRYITNAPLAGGGSVLKFSPDDSGNTAPASDLSGSKTKLTSPLGILAY